MGYIEDLVAQLYGAEAQKTIAAENPYTPFQAVPDSISQIVTGLAAKGSGNYGLGELAGTSAVSGLLSGILGGAADSYNTRTLNKYQDAITKATLGQSNTDLGLSDTLLKKADDTAASVLLRKTLQDEEAKSAADLAVKKQVELATNPDITKAELEKAAALKELEARYAQRAASNKPLEIPAQVQGELADSKAIADAADGVAAALRRSGYSYTDLSATKYFSGLDKNGINQSIQDLADRVLRSRSGAAAPLAEQNKLQAIISGDFSAGPEQIASLLQKFANLERANGIAKIDLLESLKSGDPRAAFRSQSNLSIPKGAIPTGKTSGGKPVYILNGVEGVID